jgi:hypothetical protein
VLVTGSWDKTLRYWDGRSPTPVATVNLPERAYCMDVAYPLAVVATAERHVLIYNLTNPKVEYKVRFCFDLRFSPLPTRNVEAENASSRSAANSIASPLPKPKLGLLP